MNDRAAPLGKHGRYHHGDLRRDLLRAARDEISRHGAENVSLASLARLAGVSQPAPYQHFADRKALLEAVAAEAFEALTNTMADAVAEQESADARTAALAAAYVDFGEGHIELYRLMFASRLTPDAPTGSALEKAADQAFDLLRRTLAGKAQVGQTRPDSDVYRSWAELHGLVMLKADGFITSPLTNYVR